MSSSKVLACLALLFFSTVPALADIRESKDWIVDSRAHKFLTALSEKVGTEDTVLPKSHAVATLSTSGCNLTVLVVGPVEGDAQAYARTIDGWRARQGFTGDVQWSQEDDCAAAKYIYAPGRVGMASATTTVDLPALRTALLGVEPKTQFAVSDAAWSKVDLGFPPDSTSAQGTRYWNLTADRPTLRPVSGTIRLAPWILPLVLFWFLLPIVGVLGSFGIAVLIARNERIPLERRRRLYARVVQVGTYGVLGVHGLLVAATLPTRVFEPMAQLWFGTRFTLVAIPIVPAFALVPMLALPFVNPVEKRLMGPSDEERLRQAPEPASRPLEKVPVDKRRRAVRIALTLVGFGLMAIGFFLPKTVHYRELLNPLGLVIGLLIPNLLDLRKRDLPKYAVESETLDALAAKLRGHVATMAARLEMPAPPSRVLTEAIYGRFGAVVDRKGVGVTVGALESLNPEELDFLVAHEMAHEKLGHLKRRRLVMFAPILLAFFPLTLFVFGLRPAFAVPGFVLTPVLAPLVLMVPFGFVMRRMLQRQEFAADGLAVQATGDPASAASALRKITLNSANPGVHDTDMSSHPAVGARLARLGI